MATQPSAARHRKQRFPRLERRRPYGPSNAPLGPCGDDGLFSDDDALCAAEFNHKRPRHSALPAFKPYRPVQSSDMPLVDPKDAYFPVCRGDKRARDEHNEQERSRRRELAVIYELIRCSLREDDLRYLGSFNGPRSIDKLSYPQVLHVAYHLLREEQHNLILFERTLNDIRRLEKEFINSGLSVPERPVLPSIMDSYRKVIQMVDDLLKHDKNARTVTGLYETTPAERAAFGDRQLSLMKNRLCGFLASHYVCPPTDIAPWPANPRRPTRNDLNHRPRNSELPRISSDNDEDGISVWHTANRGLKRSASSTSIGQANVGEFFHDIYGTHSGYSLSTDNTSYGSSDSGFRPGLDDEDTEVMVDFLPKRNPADPSLADS